MASPRYGELQHRIEFVPTERVAFGRALDFHEGASAVHDHVHVRFALRVPGVVEIEHGHARHDAGRHSRDLAMHWIRTHRTAHEEFLARLSEANVSPGDRSRARAAVGLQHVAVNRNGALAERFEIDHRTQRAANEALDFLRSSALFAPRGLARTSRMGRARQHAILRSHPTLAFATQKSRHTVFYAR